MTKIWNFERGATWVEGDIVWLCAAHRREEGSEDDAFKWFSDLHAVGELLPTDDDHLRDRAEAAIRLHRELTSDLYRLIDLAMSEKGTELLTDLCDWLPCRALIVQSENVQEIWCALSILEWTVTSSGSRSATFCSQSWRGTWSRQSSRRGMTGPRASFSGLKRSASACVSDYGAHQKLASQPRRAHRGSARQWRNRHRPEQIERWRCLFR